MEDDFSNSLEPKQSGPDPLQLFAAFNSYSSKFPPLKKALSTIESAVRLYTPSNIAVAFNGGKDATVVMHLTRAAVAQWSVDNNIPSKVNCLYLLGESGQQFPQVDKFVHQQVLSCQLHTTFNQNGFIEGIKEFIQGQGACAFVMGTRRADPHGQSMQHFEPSSPTWPPFMRVNPILDWEYEHVWHFLRHFELAYCEMYDRGYTSIGSIETTQQNPALKVQQDDNIHYRPAYMLTDGSLERAGRVSKS